MIGVSLAGKYTDDIDILVPTGHSTTIYVPATVALDDDVAPARDLFPKFAKLPPGYLALCDESVREAAFYSGGYDPSLAQLDFANSAAMAVGELLIQSPGFTPAVGFLNPVLVVTGAEDAVLCNPKTGKPCDQILNETRTLFPDSREYGFYAPPNTGHDVVLHFSAPETFAVVHEWLDAVGL